MSYADLKVIHSTAPIGRKTEEILRAPSPMKHLFVSALANGNWTIFADQEATTNLALWVRLAADSPKALIWIPKSGDRINWDMPGFEPCDLVLCHHSLQLRPSAWKAARTYAKMDGESKTLSVSVPDGTYDAPTLYRQRRRPPGEDVADFALHSSTVFILGSTPLFRHLADLCVFQATATSVGDHVHLFNRARHEPREGSVDDLTIGYFPPKHWL